MGRTGKLGPAEELLDLWGEAMLDVFNDVADLFVFMKDTERRFVRVSTPFVQLMGYSMDHQLLGLRDEDISPEYLAAHYREHDEQVLRQGVKIVDLVELVHSIEGTYDWFLTTKSPVRAPGGAILGLVGVTRTLTKRHAVAEKLLPLTPAVELIARDYARQLSVEDMAKAVGMSPSHFTRLFRQHFQVTPHRYLRRVRLMAACELLSTTDLSVSAIAGRTGYYDQSHLTNELAKARHLTPASYRRQFRKETPISGRTRVPLS